MYGRVNSCLYIILILKSVVCAVWNHAQLEETSVVCPIEGERFHSQGGHSCGHLTW